jgi:hypothetical protein
MRKICVVLWLAAFVGILASAVSCNTLAVGGLKKYRVEITNAASDINTEISTNGKVSEKMISKLEGILAKYKDEAGNFGTYRDAQDIIKLVKEGWADPTTEFAKYKEVQMKTNSIQDMVRTEVPD